MSPNSGVNLGGVINTVKVGFEPLFDFILGLSNILFLTDFATYAVYEVIAVTSYVVLGSVNLASGMTGNLTCFVKFAAISAFLFGYASS